MSNSDTDAETEQNEDSSEVSILNNPSCNWSLKARNGELVLENGWQGETYTTDTGGLVLSTRVSYGHSVESIISVLMEQETVEVSQPWELHSRCIEAMNHTA